MREKVRVDIGGETLKRFLGKLKVEHKKTQHYNLISTRTKLKHNFQCVPSVSGPSCGFQSKMVAKPLHIWKRTIPREMYLNGFLCEGRKN